MKQLVPPFARPVRRYPDGFPRAVFALGAARSLYGRWVRMKPLFALAMALASNPLLRAQDAVRFHYVTNQNAITVTGYVGPGGAVTIPAIVNGLPVTAIGNQAFFERSDLTQITLPDSITIIGDLAFLGCTGLTQITFPDSITTIGAAAFSGCTGLAQIVLPKRLATIEYQCFVSCTGLTQVTFPESLTSIGHDAFVGCAGLTQIALPNRLINIGGQCFAGCTSLTQVSLPSSLTFLGERAFQGCTGLKAFEVDPLNPNYSSPDGVLVDTKLSTLLQYPTKKAGGYTIPPTVTVIYYDAFRNCTDLTSVKIPATVTSIELETFSGCTGLRAIEVDPSNPSYSSRDGVLFDKNQSSLIRCPAEKAGDYTLPGSVKWIEGSAFSGCSNLVRVTVPDGVTYIGGFAFAGCSRLTEVALGQAVERLDYGLFSDCVSLRELVIPDSVQDVAAMLTGHETPVFRNCRELRQVHLGRGLSGVRWGWNDLFRTCPNLTTVSVAEDHPVYRSIEGVLFDRNATNLVFVPPGRTGRYEVPPGVLSVGYAAFGYCQDLEEVILPDSVVSIRDWAFMGCAKLREIQLPDSVAGLGDHAFFGCAGLTQIAVPNQVTYIGSSTFGGCSSLSRITIPSSVTYVEGMAFADCPNLISVRFLGKPPRRPMQDQLFGGFDGPLNTKVLYLLGTTGWGDTFGGVPTAPWLPVIGRPDFAADQPVGAFGFPIEWAPQHQVVVEACSDLAHPDWQPVGNLTLDAEGIARFNDPDSASHPTRTYRLRTP